MKSEIISRRLTYSLLANLLRAVINFGTGMLLARDLGPDQYGRLMFLIGVFLSVRSLLDCGSSTTFFTLLSQRQRSERFLGYFFIWLLIQFLLPLFIILILLPDEIIKNIWAGEQLSLVTLSFIAVYFQSTLWSALIQIGESLKLTIWVQSISIKVAITHAMAMALLWLCGMLVIQNIFITIIFEWAIASYFAINKFRPSFHQGGRENISSITKEFVIYGLPLIPYSLMGFLYDFGDRWMLQTYGGAVQQGLYSAAYQFSTLVALFTASIVNIFWREIAGAHYAGDIKRVAELYFRASRGLFFTSISLAGFLIPWSHEILRFSLGPSYEAGVIALMLMFFYPVYQTIGQIAGTLLMATGRVRAQAIIGMLFMLTSLMVSYLLLAPNTALVPGFGMGSIGLSIKMVIMQFIFVNLTAFYISRCINIKFDLLYQIYLSIGCILIGSIIYFIVQNIMDGDDFMAQFIKVLVAAAFYLFAMGIIIFLQPKLAGYTKLERNSALKFLRLNIIKFKF